MLKTRRHVGSWSHVWETTYQAKIAGQWSRYIYKIKKAYRERERGQRGFVNAMG